MKFDWKNADVPTFIEWFNEKFGSRIPNRPNITEVVYFEHCASGIGIQIDKDTFNEYLDEFKHVEGFHYSFDRMNDCTVYYIDDFPVLRLYKWGCLV